MDDVINNTRAAEDVIHTEGGATVTDELVLYSDRIISVANSYTSRVLTGVRISEGVHCDCFWRALWFIGLPLSPFSELFFSYMHHFLLSVRMTPHPPIPLI